MKGRLYKKKRLRKLAGKLGMGIVLGCLTEDLILHIMDLTDETDALFKLSFFDLAANFMF